MSIPLLCNVILDETPIRVTQHKSDADISLLVSQRIPAEGYKIHIDSAHIKIEASDKGGFVYAFQTLHQLKINNKNKWNNVFISDHPYMKWRGFMLDSGRQYKRETNELYCHEMAIHEQRSEQKLVQTSGWKLVYTQNECSRTWEKPIERPRAEFFVSFLKKGNEKEK